LHYSARRIGDEIGDGKSVEMCQGQPCRPTGESGMKLAPRENWLPLTHLDESGMKLAMENLFSGAWHSCMHESACVPPALPIAAVSARRGKDVNATQILADAAKSSIFCTYRLGGNTSWRLAKTGSRSGGSIPLDSLLGAGS
jgi:hypothetical protein